MNKPSESQPNRTQGASASKSSGSKSSRSRSQSKSSKRSPLTYPLRFAAGAVRHWKPGKILFSLWTSTGRLLRWLVLGPKTPKTKSVVRNETALAWPGRRSLRNPLNWAAWLWKGIGRYATTRPLRAIVLAFPAIGFFLSFVSSVSLGLKDGAGNQTGRYSFYLAQSVEAEDLDRARICARRMLIDSPEDEQVRLKRVLLENELGDPTVASRMMGDLAKYEDSALAAMWLAENVGDKTQIAQWPEDKLRSYADWLISASVNAPDNPLPRLELADLLTKSGDLTRARAVLMKPAKKDAESAYRLVAIENQLGERATALKRAESLMPAMQTQVIRQPSNVQLRIKAANLMVFLGRGDDAISTLRGGLLHAKTEDNKRDVEDALTGALISQVQTPLARSATSADMLKRFRLIEDARQLRPKSEAINQLIINACIASNRFQDIAVEQMRDSFYAHLTEEHLRFIEGTIAIHSGDIPSAKNLLAADAIQDASSPGVLNNLAHAILQEEDADLNEALKLCNAALEGIPNHSYFHETRGQVLFRMGRYSEAIQDLELAFSAPELRRGILVKMLKCYQALGDRDKEAQLREWVLKQRAALQQ